MCNTGDVKVLDRFCDSDSKKSAWRVAGELESSLRVVIGAGDKSELIW